MQGLAILSSLARCPCTCLNMGSCVCPLSLTPSLKDVDLHLTFTMQVSRYWWTLGLWASSSLPVSVGLTMGRNQSQRSNSLIQRPLQQEPPSSCSPRCHSLPVHEVHLHRHLLSYTTMDDQLLPILREDVGSATMHEPGSPLLLPRGICENSLTACLC